MNQKKNLISVSSRFHLEYLTETNPIIPSDSKT